MEVTEIDKVCEKYSTQRAICDELKSRLKESNEELDKLELQLIEMLEELDKVNWETNAGKFTVCNRISVNIPKSPTDKKQFFDYLKSKGIFEDLVSVNSQTLNAFYKSEKQYAEEQGIDFRIPGIGEENNMQYVKLTRR